MFRRRKWYFLRFCFISMVLDNFSPLTTSWCCQVYRDCCCKSDYLAQRKTWNCEDIKMFVLSKTLPPPPSQARQNIDFKYLFYQIIWLLKFQTGTVHQPSVNIASSCEAWASLFPIKWKVGTNVKMNVSDILTILHINHRCFDASQCTRRNT